MVIHNHLLRLIVVFAVYPWWYTWWGTSPHRLCFCVFRPQIVFKSFLAVLWCLPIYTILSVCLCVPVNYKSPEWVAWEFLIIVIMLLLYWNWIHFWFSSFLFFFFCVESCVDATTRRYFPPWPWNIYAPTRCLLWLFSVYFCWNFKSARVQIFLSLRLSLCLLPDYPDYPHPACLVYYYPFAGTFLWVKPDAAYLCDNAVGTRRNWKCQRCQGRGVEQKGAGTLPQLPLLPDPDPDSGPT